MQIMHKIWSRNVCVRYRRAPPPNNGGAKQFYYTNWNFMSDKHTAARRKIGSAQMDFEVKITARARRETR